MEESIKAYWRSVLPENWQDEQGIQNFEDVAHVVMVERGMSIEEARETIRPLQKTTIGCVECGSVYLLPGVDPPLCGSCADGLWVR